MTDATDHQTNGAGQGTATAGATKQRKTRSGLKIPQTGFAEVRELVDAMIALNGPASRNLIFDRAGKSSKGGAADARWSTLGYMGLREKTDDGRFVPPSALRPSRAATPAASVRPSSMPLWRRASVP